MLFGCESFVGEDLMKSYARRFAIALLAFAALFIFVSCGGSATDAEVMGQDSASSDAQVDDVALSRDGTAQGLVEIQVVSRERKVETYSGSVHDVVTEYVTMVRGQCRFNQTRV